MKTKLVLWGSNAAGERVLIASALNAKENQVTSWIFPLDVATEEFYNLMLNTWRFGQEVTFPEPHEEYTTTLSVTESFLPEGITAERPDILSRAQAEWHFVVLSSKLYRSYEDEIEDLRERIEGLEEFDTAVWERMKGFWGRVQSHIRDKTLFHEHAKTLRNQINGMFSDMKDLRKKMDQELKELSHKNKEEFMEAIGEIEEKIEKGLGLKPLFEELKQIQKRFRKTKFNSGDRSSVWERLDAAFKKVKKKRFGPESGRERSSYDRLKRRYAGLLAAIEKMEKSIARDKRDIDFQGKKIKESEGQLEEQIRQAKLKMIEERIRSKEDKHSEMLNTKAELEVRLAREEKKEADKKKQEEVEKVKEEVKEKIAEEIKHAAEEREDEEEKLEKAAEALKESGTSSKHKSKGKEKTVPKEDFLSAIGAALGESLQDVADTVRAVADVVEDRLEEELREWTAEEEE